MEAIKIAFSIRIEGIQFPEVEFSDTNPEFKNIIIRPIAGKNYFYEILIKKNVFAVHQQYLEPVFNEAYIEAEKFKYIFSIAADIKIYDFECLGYYQNDELKKYNAFPNRYNIRGSSATLTVTVGDKNIRSIKEKLTEEYDLSSIQMFIDASTIIEPVGRFLSLYTLMLHKYGDSQKSVDKAILLEDSTVAQFKSPHAKGYETIFSKLRNEMSHKRDSINILETQNEIKLNVDRFEKIVKAIVIKGP